MKTVLGPSWPKRWDIRLVFIKSDRPGNTDVSWETMFLFKNMFLVKPGFGWTHDFRWNSSQLIVIFPMNRNRNRFAKSTSVQIGIGIVCEFQNFQIWIWIIFVIREVFANNSRIPDIYLFSKKCLTNSFFYCYFFHLKNLLVKQQKCDIWIVHTLHLYSK